MTRKIDVEQREAEQKARIAEIREERGSSLLILGHQYQRPAVLEFSDCIGDSYALAAKAAASSDARLIVFCGVEFMAESASILSSPGQAVFHPDHRAGCPMADMATWEEAEQAFERTTSSTGGRVIPIVYMNSTAEVKAFCGRNGGLVCTSSNADAAMRWAFERGDTVLFMPDEHLGVNTADSLGIPEAARTIFDPTCADGGDLFRPAPSTRLVLWKGYCHVHTYFTPEQVEEARREHPGCSLVVHPECPRAVTGMADAVGSTSRIVSYVAEAPDHATVVVGTEINLVERLARDYAGKKNVVPLARSFCPNMFKINLFNLRETLEDLEGETFKVSVPEDVTADARKALQRMLDISS